MIAGLVVAVLFSGASSSFAARLEHGKAAEWQVCGVDGLCKQVSAQQNLQFLQALVETKSLHRATPARPGVRYFVLQRAGSALLYFIPESAKLAHEDGSWVSVSTGDAKRITKMAGTLPPAPPPTVNISPNAQGTTQFLDLKALNRVIRESTPTSIVPKGRKSLLPLQPTDMNPWLPKSNPRIFYYPDLNVITALGNAYQLPASAKKVLKKIVSEVGNAQPKKQSKKPRNTSPSASPTAHRSATSWREVLLLGFAAVLGVPTFLLFARGFILLWQLVAHSDEYVKEATQSSTPVAASAGRHDVG